MARPAAFDSDMFGGAMGSSSLGNAGSGMGLSGTSPGNDRGISTIHPMLPSRATRGFYNDLKSKLVFIVFLIVTPYLGDVQYRLDGFHELGRTLGNMRVLAWE